MNLSQMFHSEVVTVVPDDRVAIATGKMEKHNVGAVVVVDGEQVVGILTDRDVVVRVMNRGLSQETAVADVMTKNPTTVWDDQGVFDATQSVLGRGIRRLPIVDRHDRLVGMITTDDLLTLLAKELYNVAQALEPALAPKPY